MSRSRTFSRPVARAAVLPMLAGGALLSTTPALATGVEPWSAGGWIGTIFAPIDLGGWRLSPARLLVAAVLFLAILWAGRILRRVLARTTLARPRVDPGLAHSIDRAVAYATFALAAVTALSFAGVDVTSLAIVAGALSVGIGFGLQSIVSNFVSGLILLAERPVRVGDLVEVKGLRGRVRRISIRATEIESAAGSVTFVPNSEFVASPVTNLTHDGRAAVAIASVGVASDSDPDRVRRALLEAAQRADLCLETPAPSVSLDEISPGALRFSVHATVADAAAAAAAESELRLLVLRALAAAGIEIARPQSDVHLRDLDAVRAMLARAIEERTRQERTQPAPPRGEAQS